jgi:hypothetical protein
MNPEAFEHSRPRVSGRAALAGLPKGQRLSALMPPGSPNVFRGSLTARRSLLAQESSGHGMHRLSGLAEDAIWAHRFRPGSQQAGMKGAKLRAGYRYLRATR